VAQLPRPLQVAAGPLIREQFHGMSHLLITPLFM
jgi:hypothetical protein